MVANKNISRCRLLGYSVSDAFQFSAEMLPILLFVLRLHESNFFHQAIEGNMKQLLDALESMERGDAVQVVREALKYHRDQSTYEQRQPFPAELQHKTRCCTQRKCSKRHIQA